LLAFRLIYCVAPKAQYIKYWTFGAPCIWAEILRYFCPLYFICGPKMNFTAFSCEGPRIFQRVTLLPE
jgi:hypothetical protein